MIGIGSGDPEQLTLQAVTALNRADVFFILDKGQEKSDLVQLRLDILEQHAKDRPYRVVQAQDPERDRTTGSSATYAPAVDDWRRARSDIYERLIGTELGDDQCGAFLVWGDPALYDSTLGILEDVAERGTVRFEYEVIPGISSVSALVARHRTGLNQVGRPVQITTGRRLAQGLPEGVDDIVVMLDAHQTYGQLPDPEQWDIYWGAYIGTPDELLVSGNLAQVRARISTVRAEARARKGWIMDTYLLRHNPA